MRFSDYDALTEALQTNLIEAIKAEDWGDRRVTARTGYSNVSCSAYVTVAVQDADGERLETEDGDDEFKVRFSDHANSRHADCSIRFDDYVDDIEEDGEWVETEIAEEDFRALVQWALAEVREFVGRVARPEDWDE